MATLMGTWQRRILASRTLTSPVVQQALGQTPAYKELLADNREALARETWFAWYTKRPATLKQIATSLIAHPLDAEQITHVLVTETRGALVKTLIARSDITMTRAHKETIAARKEFTARKDGAPANALAAEFIKHLGPDDVDLLGPVWAATGELPRLRYLTKATWLTLAQIVPLVGNWGWLLDKPSTERNTLLRQALDSHPDLIASMAQSPARSARMTAAGSRHLTANLDQRAVLAPTLAKIAAGEKPTLFDDGEAFVIMTFAHNPVADLDLVREVERYVVDPEKNHGIKERLSRHPYRVEQRYEDIDDLVTLDWLVRRVFPNNGNVRNSDLLALLRNPHLTDILTGRLVRNIDEFSDRVLLTDDLVAAVTEACARHEELEVPYCVEKLADSVADTDAADEDFYAAQRTGRTVIGLPAHEEALDKPLNGNVGFADETAAAIALELGENVSAWTIAMGFIEGFQGTARDFVEQCQLLA